MSTEGKKNAHKSSVKKQLNDLFIGMAYCQHVGPGLKLHVSGLGGQHIIGMADILRQKAENGDHAVIGAKRSGTGITIFVTIANKDGVIYS